MKRTVALLLVLLPFSASNAQNQPIGFHLDKPLNMAAILASRPSTRLGFSSVSEASTIINDIMDAADMQQNFTVVATTQVDNAVAVIYQNKRYILYNPSFINQLDEVAKEKWASISVLCHEIGHHLLGHTLDGRGSEIPKELQADEFSGLVLHRMGATLQQAQLAMRLIGSRYASATHPAEGDRLTAIAKGWNSTTLAFNRNDNDVAIHTANQNKTSSYPNNYPEKNYPSNNSREGNHRVEPDRRQSPTTNNQRNYPPANDRSNTYPDNDARMSRRQRSTNDQAIVYDIRFRGFNAGEYYITSSNKVVTLRGNREFVVAKIAATNRSYYPYMIYDDQQQIFVDKRGNLYNAAGRNIGYITYHS